MEPNTLTTEEKKAEEITEIPDVAKSIYIPCKKCETDRYCTIVAHKTKAKTSAKVKCEVCGAQSTFSLKKKKKKAVRKKRASKGLDAATWEALKTEKGDKGAISYTVKQIFRDQDSLSHPKFGLGFVTKVYAHKVEVLFSDGAKELLHART